MKNSVRIPPLLMVIFFMVSFALLFMFGAFWLHGHRQINDLAKQEKELRGDLVQLDNWGKWTIDYVKINKALNYLSKDKLTEETKLLLTEQIWKISRSYSVDPLLILAVVEQESRGNPYARGHMKSGKESGAMGLMQIKLETAQKMGQKFGLRIESNEDLFRPEVNVAVGTAYLIRLIGKYQNLKHALIAYNLGHSAVDRMLESGTPLPTRYYEHVILKYRNLAEKSFL